MHKRKRYPTKEVRGSDGGIFRKERKQKLLQISIALGGEHGFGNSWGRFVEYRPVEDRLVDLRSWVSQTEQHSSVHIGLGILRLGSDQNTIGSTTRRDKIRLRKSIIAGARHRRYQHNHGDSHLLASRNAPILESSLCSQVWI